MITGLGRDSCSLGDPSIRTQIEEQYGELLFDRYMTCLLGNKQDFLRAAKCFACGKSGKSKDCQYDMVMGTLC